ncbi:hypothetical protein Pla123a_38130 [Posidoniimonas polymericola]|uniref:Globin domain-containing protein n=1 Tax=Posidoniimonas polymericola TaxID=2528002 RepID=A0A5C5YCN7_9BACT|nr:globin [Posidoniimonas polymericola]TWT73477.1 hypothetical protein Pla123a_38130 [Posidoniimonas polymericola]
MPFRKDRFLASLKRCRESERFAHEFYARLRAKDDAIRDRFRFTDFETQVKKFNEALDICVDATEGKQEALARLRELGVTHDIDHHNILPDWYELWIEALLQTAEESDPQWNAETAAAWRSLLERITGRMASFYLPPGHPGR